MPWHVEHDGGSRPWKIVKNSGKVVGSSTSEAAANASVRARYAAESGKLAPLAKKRGKLGR